MAARADPLSWVRELGRGEPWLYELFAAFARVYLRADERHWAQACGALPGIERQVARLHELRSPLRRN